MTKSVKWDITWRCNLRCKHCGAVPYLEKVMAKETLSTETIERVLLDLKENHFNKITFLGGEPLLRDDFIQILKYADEIGLTTIFSTNGTLLTKRVARHLAQIATLKNITMSIYGGLKETHAMIVGKNNEMGVYEGLSHISKTIKESNTETKLALNIAFTNYLIREGAEPLANLADSYNVDLIYPLLLTKQGNAYNYWDELNPMPKDVMKYIKNLITNLKQINKKRRIASKNEVKLSLGTIPSKFASDILKIYGPLSFLKINTLEHQCPVVNNEKLYVTPEGHVYPCDPFRIFMKEIEEKLEKKINPPTITESPVKDILESEYFNLLCNYFVELQSINTREECRSCEFITRCNKCPFVLNFTDTPVYCGEYYV